MSKEPIKFLDTVLKQQDEDNINDEKPYNQERRKFSISRSGRFKSRNKHRESLDSNLFTSQESNISSSSSSNNIDNQIDKTHNKDNNFTNYNKHLENDKFMEQPKSQENQKQEKNDNKLKEFFETSL